MTGMLSVPRQGIRAQNLNVALKKLKNLPPIQGRWCISFLVVLATVRCLEMNKQQR